MRNTPPIFIVGCGSSGTTLFRMILNNHPNLAIPMESHFIYDIARQIASGKFPASLNQSNDWNKFLKYLKNHHYLNRWGISLPLLFKKLEGIEDRTYAPLFTAIFNEFMQGEGKPRWGDKTPMNVNYIILIDHFFPKAKFVHIIRDGRDAAMSFLPMPWGPRRIEYAGYYWKWLVLRGMVCGKILGPERYREINFEDLLKEPEKTIKSLCNFLDLEYDPVMFDYYKSKEVKKYAQLL